MKVRLAMLALRAVRRAERARWPHIEVRDVVMVLLVGACLLFCAHLVNSSQQKWCSTLTLLTSRPVPRPAEPRANPSREQAFVLYSDFVQLRHRLGCG